MKIAYVLNSGNVGGAEKHVLDLVEGFSHDNEVVVVCPEGEMVNKYKLAGADVIIDKPSFDIDIFYIFRLKRLLVSRSIDIAHLHQLKTVINGLISASLAQTKVKIAHIHSPLSKWQIPLYKKILDLLMNFLVVNLLADVVIALTEETKQERMRGEHIREDLIRVIPNGVTIEKIKPQAHDMEEAGVWLRKKYQLNKEYLVGTLSRLTEEKGTDVFIKAISRMPALDENLYRNCHFFIAGEGHLRGELEKLVKSTNLESMVTFLGFLSEDDHAKYFKSLNLFVFPTLHEGFGLVLAEAMAYGVATLSSDLPVLKEITNAGRFGKHFARGSEDDLAEKMISQLKGEEGDSATILAAQQWIKQNYSKELFISRYRKLYQEALGNK